MMIISQKGKKTIRLDQSSFAKEDHLQEYIYENPETIPLYEIKDDVNLLILAREFQTDSGPIDAIGVDKDGDVYLVETKLYKNNDKRLVVAQVLDYGASLWRSGIDFPDFVARLNQSVQQKFKIGLNAKLCEFFHFETVAEADALLNNIKNNLNEGVFKFVVLMDKLHDRLKDLIVFLNQNSKFDVYAVELEYYRHDTWEIMIPKLFGAEVKKDIKVSGGRNEKAWDETSFFEDVKQYLSEKERMTLTDLYNFLKNNFSVKFGSGSTRGSFSVQLIKDGSPLTLLEMTAKGKIQFYISSLIKRGIAIDDTKKLVNDLSVLDQTFAVTGDLSHSYSSAKISSLKDSNKIERLKDLLLEYRDLWND
jgi:hypothetical protein